MSADAGGRSARVARAASRLEPEARKRIALWLELVAAERASVTSVRDLPEAWKVHVDDSLSGLEFVVSALGDDGAVADVGSGAGFPGMPLAVALPGARVDLIESVTRKCAFLRRAAAAVGISNLDVVCGRAEEWASRTAPAGGREAYDVVTARAVGRLSTLAELASPLLRTGGVLVAWKGRRDRREEEQLWRAAGRLAMHADEVRWVGPYAGARHRHLHVIRKTDTTPDGLPRRPGMAKKRPFG